MATITSGDDGDANAGGTWTGEVVPGENDDVVVVTNVEVTENVTWKSLTVNNGALILDGDVTLTITGDITVEGAGGVITTDAASEATIVFGGDINMASTASIAPQDSDSTLALTPASDIVLPPAYKVVRGTVYGDPDDPVTGTLAAADPG